MEKGKRSFKMDEYKRLRELVSQLENADRQKSKSIRAKLRDIGLYWSEVANGADYTVRNLDHLFEIGTLKISEGHISNIITKKDFVAEKDTEIFNEKLDLDIKEITKKLIHTPFLKVKDIESGERIPNVPGIYCIKLRHGISFPKDYGKIREDGIIYIGKADKSLRKRLWDQELNHNGHATFFRSIGAMLDLRPPKGSLSGSTSRNYEFNEEDTKYIRFWMRECLMVNFVPVPVENIEPIENSLIKKYCPLVNIKGNPQKSRALEVVRKECVEIAQSQP